MSSPFKTIGLFAKTTGEAIADTLQQLIKILQSHGHEVLLEQASANYSQVNNVKNMTSDQIGSHCDLIIVVGGDGSMLKAARSIVDNNIPIIGINRGQLGFLADINPQQLEKTLLPILQGEFIEEQRTMLNVTIIKNNQQTALYLALNDVVLHHGDVARLLEFELYINNEFVFDQRSDGLIASTPTGSTAYALSGGGPIIYPNLDVISLVPMFPHTLSARPIVINKNSHIKLTLTKYNQMHAKISCDGQTHMTLDAGDEIHIQSHKNNLRLLHPQNYNYFSVLREKLGWNSQ